MRVIAVLDLKGGVVVRGIGGRRELYQPVVSSLTASCQPVDVAEAIRSRLGLRELYLADLDAIAGAAPAIDLFADLKKRGFRLWVDAGLRHAPDAESLANAGVDRVVAGLETLAGPEELSQLVTRLGERLVFSLDLRAGTLLAGGAGWPADPFAVGAEALRRGVRRLLVLDLAQVGTGSGPGTESLCARLSQTFAEVEISAGGGVRGVEDLIRLGERGVSAVLVASALHDGRLPRSALQSLGAASED